MHVLDAKGEDPELRQLRQQVAHWLSIPGTERLLSKFRRHPSPQFLRTLADKSIDDKLALAKVAYRILGCQPVLDHIALAISKDPRFALDTSFGPKQPDWRDARKALEDTRRSLKERVELGHSGVLIP